MVIAKVKRARLDYDMNAQKEVVCVLKWQQTRLSRLRLKRLSREMRGMAG